ncbi:uncharacterized protein LOC130979702 [Arachis stenosperma]|uniref:uncharacterized protein LOC130979702 n=1 Tax=Arachis stenosperma TaxID=217475 RepID=UPI0025ABF0E8|nr:uncharacterized protein LOC130979702 [Arachis stenosperma]
MTVKIIVTTQVTGKHCVPLFCFHRSLGSHSPPPNTVHRPPQSTAHHWCPRSLSSLSFLVPHFSLPCSLPHAPVRACQLRRATPRCNPAAAKFCAAATPSLPRSSFSPPSTQVMPLLDVTEVGSEEMNFGYMVIFNQTREMFISVGDRMFNLLVNADGYY